MAKKNHNKRPAREFKLVAPGATLVQLVGTFTNWQENPITLQSDDGVVWKTKVALQTGTYRYRFLVDGVWVDDPDCSLREPNDFGSENMLLSVP